MLNNHKILIAEHILPHEIDRFETQMRQLNKSSLHIQNSVHIELYVVLNISPTLVEFKKENLKKFIIDKFEDCKSMCSWVNKCTFKIIDDDSILGVVDFRRDVVRNYDASITDLIFLDSDLCFHETLLAFLISSLDEIKNKYYVIVPQTVKLWDYTWDVLTHKDFVDKPYGFERIFDATQAETQEISDVGLVESSVFKFAGGWFNLYCMDLWRFVGVPDEFGPYGVEDTFIMFASEIMKQRNYDVQQYILQGQYIAENYLYKNPYTNDIVLKGKKELWTKNANAAFPMMVEKFSSQLKMGI